MSSGKKAPTANRGSLSDVLDQERGNDTETQKRRLLKALELYPSITTIQARSELDIMHPAGRIKELRDSGNRIDRYWVDRETTEGRTHKVARYVLQSAATIKQGSSHAE